MNRIWIIKYSRFHAFIIMIIINHDPLCQMKLTFSRLLKIVKYLELFVWHFFMRYEYADGRNICEYCGPQTRTQKKQKNCFVYRKNFQ